jgi:hypothetical protein
MKSAARLLLLTSLRLAAMGNERRTLAHTVHASLTEGEQSDYGIKSERETIDERGRAQGES